MAHFLAEMRRLRAQYYCIGPDTKISDKAWAQKLLQKASLSRRERHDCFYAAGDSIEIEKALRVRCGRIHEEEKHSTSYYKSSRPTWETSSKQEKTNFKPRKFIKKKPQHTHVAEEAHGENQEEAAEEAENEAEGLSPEDEELKGFFFCGRMEGKTEDSLRKKEQRLEADRQQREQRHRWAEEPGRPQEGHHMQLMWQAGALAR